MTRYIDIRFINSDCVLLYLPSAYYWFYHPCLLSLWWQKMLGAVVVLWLSSWIAEQEIRGSIPGLIDTISEIGYLLLPSHDRAERLLKRRKSSKQPTNDKTCLFSPEVMILIICHAHDPWTNSLLILGWKVYVKLEFCRQVCLCTIIVWPTVIILHTWFTHDLERPLMILRSK